jgi:hypothetical protein
MVPLLAIGGRRREEPARVLRQQQQRASRAKEAERDE